MTPATLVNKVWTTRRGVGGMLMLWTVLVAGLLYVVATGYAEQAPLVRYGSDVYAPLDAGPYCPGDAVRFDNHVSVTADELPAIIHVVEGWRNNTSGITLRSTVSTYEIPVVRPADLFVTTTRQIPDALTPGVWWLDHVAVNGHASGYTVGPVEVVACP